MADPLSFAASVAALLQFSATVIKYLSDVEDARDDLKRLRAEVISAIGLLSTLKVLAATGEVWLVTVQSLSVPDGPLEQFRYSLERLSKMLPPLVGLKKVLAWSFQKSEVTDILCAIERQKMLFTLALQNDQLRLSQAINAKFAEVGNEVRKTAEGVVELQKSYKDQKRRDIILWLSALNFSTRQNDFFGRRQEGTGEWLLETEAFKKWLDGTERTLWCPGLPGTGKTVLTSIVVDYLERSFGRDNIAVAYIYCSYKEQECQTDVNLIASLLQQLVERNSFIPDEISSLYHRHIEKQTRPTLGEWSKLLQLEVRRLSKVFIVIDALDECSNGTKDSFLAEIRKLPNIHLLVTSRPILTIEREFERTASIEICASDEDVRRYLEGRIKRECRLARHVKADPTLQETIISTIVEKAKGMFLLAQLYMDSLAKKPNRRDVRLALENLPKELDDIYQGALLRIESQHEDDAKLAERVLSWISLAFRPLTIREIQHALAIEPGDTDFDVEAVPDEDILVSVCAGLVTIDRESNIIRLVHYTVQEYFDRTWITRFPYAQTNIATTCLVYISFNVFADGYCRSDQEMEIRMYKFPLLEYAARHWGDHARGDPEETIKELALRFLDHNSKLMCSNQVMHLSEYRYSEYSQIFPKHITGLHIVAYIGLAKIVRLLLEREGVDADSKDNYGRTSLSWAARGGHEAVARVLLECEGVDADSKDNDRRTPLSWAAEKGHETVVQLLLGHAGVDANSKDNYGQTPLFWAAKKGHKAVMQQLLECENVDINSKDNYGETPLSWAARKGQETAVRLLLEREDVDMDSKTIYGHTPLSSAKWYGQEAMVELLLEFKGVRADSKDHYSWMLLSWAAEKGDDAVVNDACDRKLLSLAVGHGNEAAMQLLLKRKGFDANFKANEFGETPLSLAAGHGHVAVVRLLMEHEGIDVDPKDDYGSTPLSAAAEKGHNVVVQLLLEHEGVDADSKDNYGRTPLSWAAELGHEAVVRLLLERRGVDANFKDNYGRTPLSYAAEEGHEGVVQLLTPLTSDS